jgi:hypothetical protein
MSDDPVLRRLVFAKQEIDDTFGQGYAQAHPEVVVAVMQRPPATMPRLPSRMRSRTSPSRCSRTSRPPGTAAWFGCLN